jgi:opacity protein-like surface antigen
MAAPASAAQTAPASPAAPASAAQTAAAVQAVRPAPANNVYKIGDTGPAGGYIFYDKGVVTYGWRYLEAAPDDLPAPIRWGPNNTVIKDTETAVGTGKANTQRIAPIINRHGEDGAALLCTALNINGYQDWFLPSKDELNLMYVNLKKKGLGGFGDGYYWSSSEYNYFDAWVQRFRDGSQNYSFFYTKGDKDHALPVRAIRAF